MNRRKKVVLLLSLFVLFTLLLLVPEQESATSYFDGISVQRDDGYFRCVCPRHGGDCGCVYYSEE